MRKHICSFFAIIMLMVISCSPDNGPDTPVPPVDVPGQEEKPDNTPIIAQTDSLRFKTTVKVDYKIKGKVAKLISVLPVPVTNEYQTVKNLECDSGEIKTIAGTENKYSVFVKESPSGNEVHSEKFEVTLFSVKTDFSRMTTIHDYNTESEEYNLYRGKRGNIVDPANEKIKSIGDKIWGQSKDILDYARRCYEHVAREYKYLNPNTGLHPLEKILKAGGGDCGNLSTIFISLLRYKDIPSRHIITVRPDGTFHVWADFYMEGYGWIPVDVTLKNEHPSGDYFGYYEGDGIVVCKDVLHELEVDDVNSYTVTLLQTFFYWYWRSESSATVTPEYNVSGVRIRERSINLSPEEILP